MQTSILFSLLISVALAGQVSSDTVSSDTVPGEENSAVESGRAALSKWFQGNHWYDSDNDSARPIDVSPSWSEQMAEKLDWLWNWSWKGFGQGPRFRGSWWPNSLFMWLAWIFIFVLLGLVLYLMIRTYRRRAQQRLSMQEGTLAEKEDDLRRVEALPFPVRDKPADLLRVAHRHYKEGRYTQAVLFLFSHQLVELDRNHFIRLTKGKTNRQYVREIGQRLSLRSIVVQTMVLFEDAFFGDYTIDRIRFEACWEKLDEFNTLIGKGAI